MTDKRPQRIAFILICTSVCIGSALRIEEYVRTPSLSLDETFLGLNIITKSARSLAGPLNFDQAAPVGFLEITKLAVAIFGRSEFVLRLLPLLVSLLGLVFFYSVAMRLITPRAALTALIVFALFDPIVYYAANAKQYSFDVGATLGIYFFAGVAFSRETRESDALKFAILGAAVIWLSHPAAFILAAVSLILIVKNALIRSWRSVSLALLATGVWLTSLTLEVLLSRDNLMRIQRSFGPGSGLLLAKSSPRSPTWVQTALDRFRYFVGLEDTVSGEPALNFLPHVANQGMTALLLGVGVLGIGTLVLARPRTAALLTAPPAFVLVASSFGQYPLVGRTLLFLVPSVALCIGVGVSRLMGAPQARARLAAGAIGSAILIGPVAVLPAMHAIQPRTNEELRSALAYLGRRYRPGDGLFVGARAQYGLAYYHLCHCAGFDPESVWNFYVEGSPTELSPAIIPASSTLVIETARAEKSLSIVDLRPLLGRRRVWILVAQMSAAEQVRFFAKLDVRGQVRSEYKSFGTAGPAVLRLYDFHGKANS